LNVARELVHEERVTAGLVRDRVRQVVRAVVPAKQGDRELARLGPGQGAHHELVGRSRHRRGGRRGGLAAGQLARDQDEEQRRCLRRPHDLVEQGQAVGVRPLHVVDHQHQGGPLGEARQQLAGGAEGAAPQLARIADGVPRRGGLGERLDRAQRGEHLGQPARLGRHQRGHLRRGQRSHVRDHRVEQAVDGLERDQLVLVAARGQHDGAGPFARLLREATQQRRLAHAGLAGQVDRGRAIVARAVEVAQEHVELVAAAHERRPAALLGRGSRVQTRRAVDAESREHLLIGRSRLGGAAQQIGTQRVQIVRDAVDEAQRRQRLEVLLGRQDLHGGAIERELPGHRQEEERPHAVPVGGGADDAPALLGRGERRCADHLVRAGQVGAAIEVGHQAEVEQHDPPARLHADVRRLDVAVDLADLVQGGHPAGELREGGAQARFVEGEVPGRAPADRRGLAGRPRHLEREGLPGVRVAAADRTDVLVEVDAVDVLHREEPGSGLLDQLAEADQVRVLEIVQRAELGLEAGQRVGPGLLQQLEGDPAVQGAIEGLEDLAHPARSDTPQ
jgi:hypothetical protein